MRRLAPLVALLALVVAPSAGAATSKHGQLVASHRLTGDAALTSAGRNWFVKYRSVGFNGKPINVTGVVSLPKGKPPKKGWPVTRMTTAPRELPTSAHRRAIRRPTRRTATTHTSIPC